MKSWHLKSLTLRIWITFITFIVIIILCISLIYYFFMSWVTINSQLDNLRGIHETVVNFINQKPDFSLNNTPQFDLSNNTKNMASHMIIGRTGDDLLSAIPINRHFDRNRATLLPIADLMLSYIEDANTRYIDNVYNFEGRSLLFAITQLDTLETSYLASYIFLETRYDYLYTFISIGVVFIILALIVAKVISNYISKPLRQLEQQTLKIAQHEWVDPMIATSHDEIGSLINSINYMQSSLQEAEQEQHRFLQSISHDLKTPIMVILGHAEAIKDGIYIDNLENTADIIKNEAIRLENKVKQILYYNTLDYILPSNQDQEEIDLSKLITYTVRRLEAVSPHLTWNLTLSPTLIFASSERILVALENILDNQIRYAKSHITIFLIEEPHQALLKISNDGMPIEANHLPRLFQHLYRGSEGKFGLGLTITHKIITHYHGTLTAENTPTGVCFTITLPTYKKDSFSFM